MITAFRAELRKLFTVRSTYIFLAITLLIVVFFAFYVEGYHLKPGELNDPQQIANDVTNAISAISLFSGLVAILLMTHEYRYNTIIYTLISSNRRSKVLLAKFFAISAFSLIFTILFSSLSPALAYLGVHAHGHAFGPQVFDAGSIVWRTIFYGWAYAQTALVLAFLIRNQIGAIVSLFLVPTIEQLLTLLLNNNSVYLPLTALGSLLSKPVHGTITYGRAVAVFSLYLIVGWFVAWQLFKRRDAN